LKRAWEELDVSQLIVLPGVTEWVTAPEPIQYFQAFIEFLSAYPNSRILAKWCKLHISGIA
jgi:hypothetical protein